MEKFKCSCSIWKIKAVWARLGDWLPVVGGGTGEVMALAAAAVVVVETLPSRNMGWTDWGNSATAHRWLSCASFR